MRRIRFLSLCISNGRLLLGGRESPTASCSPSHGSAANRGAHGLVPKPRSIIVVSGRGRGTFNRPYPAQSFQSAVFGWVLADSMCCSALAVVLRPLLLSSFAAAVACYLAAIYLFIYFKGTLKGGILGSKWSLGFFVCFFKEQGVCCLFWNFLPGGRLYFACSIAIAIGWVGECLVALTVPEGYLVIC